MEWTRERVAFILCGAGVGSFINLWITLASPWIGLVVPCLLGIWGMYHLATVAAAYKRERLNQALREVWPDVDDGDITPWEYR